MKTLSVSCRWAVGALVVSFGVNMFLGGFLLARPPFGPPPPPERHMEEMVERLAAILPAADARILRETFAEKRDTLRPPQQEGDAMRRKIQALLRSEPFAGPAMLEILEAGRDEHRRFESRLHQELVAVLDRFSAQGRQTFADFLSRPPRP